MRLNSGNESAILRQRHSPRQGGPGGYSSSWVSGMSVDVSLVGVDELPYEWLTCKAFLK
jgi:hypothetical protein